MRPKQSSMLTRLMIIAPCASGESGSESNDFSRHDLRFTLQRILRREGQPADGTFPVVIVNHSVAFKTAGRADIALYGQLTSIDASRSEEHTSELQSRSDLVCRLLL